jgi:hypothetical protein
VYPSSAEDVLCPPRGPCSWLSNRSSTWRGLLFARCGAPAKPSPSSPSVAQLGSLPFILGACKLQSLDILTNSQKASMQVKPKCPLWEGRSTAGRTGSHLTPGRWTRSDPITSTPRQSTHRILLEWQKKINVL